MPTRRLRTSGSDRSSRNSVAVSFFINIGFLLWHAKLPLAATATSVSARTSTPVRRQRPSVSSITPVLTTRSAKFTMARPRWTGWSRSRSAALPSLPRQRPASGRGWRANSPSIVSTSSTPRDTSTSPSKSSARCACSTVRAWSIVRSAAFSRSRKPFGGKPISTRCRGWRSSIRWTARAPTSSRSSIRCTRV